MDIRSLVGICSVAVLALPAFSQAEEQCIKNKFIVKFRPASVYAESSANLPYNKLRQLGKNNRIGLVEKKLASMAAPDEKEQLIDCEQARAEADSLKTESLDIEFAEPDRIRQRLLTPNDPLYSPVNAAAQTYLFNGPRSIQAPAAWDITTGAASVIVGDIDDGIDLNHPDLIPNLWTNPSEISGNNIDDDNNGYIDDIHGINGANGTGNPQHGPSLDDGHGTATAGVIVAKGNNGIGITGVAWDVKVAVAKASNSSGNLTLSGIINGYYYFYDLKQAGRNIVAVNASFGGSTFSQSEKDAIDALGQVGILLVAAAGNGDENGVGYSNDQDPLYPASYSSSNIISVAASKVASDGLASFSNFGPTSVDIAAPGLAILTTTPTFTTNSFLINYDVVPGTSFAAPQVTGAIALIKSIMPNLNVQQVKDAILNGGTPRADLAGLVVSGKSLNLQGALIAAQNTTITPPPPPPTGVSQFSFTVQSINSKQNVTVKDKKAKITYKIAFPVKNFVFGVNRLTNDGDSDRIHLRFNAGGLLCPVGIGYTLQPGESSLVLAFSKAIDFKNRLPIGFELYNDNFDPNGSFSTDLVGKSKLTVNVVKPRKKKLSVKVKRKLSAQEFCSLVDRIQVLDVR